MFVKSLYIKYFVLSLLLIFVVGCKNDTDEIVSVEKSDRYSMYCDNANHIHAIDLGLSVKWGCCNLDASYPWEMGGMYAWGETFTKTDYSIGNYSHFSVVKCGGGAYHLISSLKDDISGTKHDAARAKLGGSWRMPTFGDFKELWEKCHITPDSIKAYGGDIVKGFKVTGPNGNSIFLTGENSTKYWIGNMAALTSAMGMNYGCDHSGNCDMYNYKDIDMYHISYCFYVDRGGDLYYDVSDSPWEGLFIRPVCEF